MSVTANFNQIEELLESIIEIAERNEEEEMDKIEAFLNDQILADATSALTKIRNPQSNYDLNGRKR